MAAAMALEAGTKIRYDDSRVVTLAPGKARVRRKTELETRHMGAVERLSRERYDGPAARRTLRLRQGEQMEVLSYRAEGLCFLRLGREVYEAPCPQNDRKRFEMIEEPDVEWWLHMGQEGRTGWFYAEGEGIDFLSREF